MLRVDGMPVMPAGSIDRMEVPTRTWAAQQGLKTGYGMSNYWSIHEGFVYHGHNGGVEGGLTEMAYLPDYMGNLTGWSVAFFLGTVAYAVASVAGAIALWRAPKQEVRGWVRRFSTAVILALLIAAAYLAYWGVIGLRTWA